MKRTEENEKALDYISENASSVEQMNAMLLIDISRSLAVIADALLMRNAEKKNEISKAADEYFEKLINGEFGEGGPHATN